MRERRWLRRVARDEPQLAAMNPLEHARAARRSPSPPRGSRAPSGDQRVIGNLAIAGNVLEARRGVGKHRGHQVVGLHPLQLRRHLASAAAAAAPPARWSCSIATASGTPARRGTPAPARRASSGMQVAEDVGERKRVLRPERQQQRILGRRRLQLEVELPAEALAQRQAPGLVDAAAERRVQHQLHAARLVEEPLEHERLLRRHRRRARGGRRPRYATACSAAPPSRAPVSLRQPCDRSGRRHPGSSSRLSTVRAQIADRARQLVAPRRRLAEPERNGRRRALRVGDADRRRRDLQDPPRRVARAGRCRRRMLSIAKSSLSVPMNVSSGSRTTR